MINDCGRLGRPGSSWKQREKRVARVIRMTRITKMTKNDHSFARLGEHEEILNTPPLSSYGPIMAELANPDEGKSYLADTLRPSR